MHFYIHQEPNWPNFTWNNDALMQFLSNIRYLQGRLIGKMESLGFDLQNEANLEMLTLDVLKTSEIEGEIFNLEQVRSSLAKRLGIEISGLVASDRHIDGVVDMLLDATQHFMNPLTQEWLFDWHAAMFPTGRSGMYKIVVEGWRDDATGPMQVVSGALGRENVHYEAPDAINIDNEMTQFLDWFNTQKAIDPILKASITHLWFVTIHPFEDGNGRIARALTDMLLARADGVSRRFYSISSQIRVERKGYYDILEKTQKGDLDITAWLSLFLYCLESALSSSEETLRKVITKHQFWVKNASIIQNERQKLMLNKLLDSFEGKLTSSRWAKITKSSTDTALRDIQDLVNKNIL